MSLFLLGRHSDGVWITKYWTSLSVGRYGALFSGIEWIVFSELHLKSGLKQF